MDMSKFPYRNGDVLSNGVKIIHIIKGDGNDSFKAYLYKKVFPDGRAEEFESKVKLPNSQTIYLDGVPTAIKLLEIAIIGNPDAARVFYNDPNQVKGQDCKPEEFLAKYPYDKFMGNDSPNPTNEVFCAAKTASGDPCKRKAADGLYCPQHAAKANG